MQRMPCIHLGAVALLLAACAPESPAPQSPALSPPPASTNTEKPGQVRPYLVPVHAAGNELMGWPRREVEACFGAPVAQDQIAGLSRYMFQREGCTEWIMFRDGKVHSVEGFGDVQTCWWVVDACAG